MSSPRKPQSLKAAATAHRRARERERAAMAALYAAIVREYAAGATEVDIAAAAGINRMTVRKALGKQ